MVLLHCWLGSWNYWLSTMEYLAKYNYKTYALDFWGFGESAKQGAFSVTEYVEMVYQFMERMGLRRSPVMGHSMGGTVSLSLALTTERVTKVAVVGPLSRDRVGVAAQIVGPTVVRGFALHYSGFAECVIKLLSLTYAKDWRKLWDMLKKDLSNDDVESFSRSINDLRHTDLSPRLGECQCPRWASMGARTTSSSQARRVAAPGRGPTRRPLLRSVRSLPDAGRDGTIPSSHSGFPDRQ